MTNKNIIFKRLNETGHNTAVSRRSLISGVAGVALSGFLVREVWADNETNSVSGRYSDSAEPSITPVLTMITYTAAPLEVGNVGDGRRFMIPLTGGIVTGKLNGSIVEGGESWLRERPDGHIEYVVRYFIKAENEQIIADHAHGFIRGEGKGAPYTRTVHHFEAPKGPYEWLNASVFVGTVDKISGGRKVTVYELV